MGERTDLLQDGEVDERGEPRKPYHAENAERLQELSETPPPVAPVRCHNTKGLLAAIACTVLGSRLIIISAFGSPVPVLDQWDAEAAVVYSPHLKGVLTFADLLTAHNEHRIFVTRLLALVHLELAGEWNTRLEMVINAAVFTALITWLAALLLPMMSPQRRLLMACFVAFMFGLPIDFENTLWGFQSQVYFSLLLGLASLVAFSTARPFSMSWFGGSAAAVLSYFSYATGIAALAGAALLLSWQLATNARKRCGREVIGVVVLGLSTAALTLWEAQGATPKSTLWTFVQGLGIFAALTIAASIPIVLFSKQALAKRPDFTDQVWLMIWIFSWIAIQLVLIAYGRGRLVAPRYMDVVLLCYPLALVAVFALSDAARAAGLHRRSVPGPATWLFCVATVIAIAGCVSVLASNYWSKAASQQVADVRAYLATGQLDRLKERGNPIHGVSLMLPDPRGQARVLKDPDVRAILPPELRPADANNGEARRRMLLKGKLASPTATAFRFTLAAGPIFLAGGIGLFFAIGAARSWQADACRTGRRE
ncbi:MAG: hypothetical protein EKK34_28705 [Mycobacterium sp.]|nr:MAG: hypothetical protein EKK34_28705 [Mycobacterium sp.]